MYFGNWASREDVAESFGVELPDDIHILFASYSYEDYDGHAYVLFERGGKLFETSGSHCSCYGLEDQWEPVSETTPAASRTYLAEGNWYVNDDNERAAVLAALDAFEKEHPSEDAAA